MKNLVNNTLLKHSKFLSIVIVLIANALNNLLTFIAEIYLAKKFGPETFGIFSLSVSVMMVVYMLSDLGFNLTMVRFFNLYSNNKKQQNQLLTTLLLFRLTITATLLVLALPAGIELTKIFAISYEQRGLFALAVTSGGILSLWMYWQNLVQSYKHFSKLAIFIILYGFIRITFFISILFVSGDSMSTAHALGSLYTLPSVIVTTIGLLLSYEVLFASGIPGFAEMKAVIKQALKYSKWVAIAGICYSFNYRIIQFFLGVLSNQKELGIFSAGFIFTTAFTTLNFAVKTVFFPYVTEMDKNSSIEQHFIKLNKILPYYVIFAVIGIILLSLVQAIFLDNRYSTSLVVFWITSIALAASIFMGLVSMLLHTLMHPEIDALVNIVRLCVASLLSYILIPCYGAIGGAIAYAIPLLFGDVYLVLKVKQLLKKVTIQSLYNS